MGKLKWGYLFLGGAFASAAMIAGGARMPVAPAAADVVVESTGTTGSAAAQVFVDPRSGALGGPSPAQVATLRKSLETTTSRSDAGLVIRKNVHGGETVNLMGRFQNVSIATATTAGPRTNCIADATHIHDAATPVAQ